MAARCSLDLWRTGTQTATHCVPLHHQVSATPEDHLVVLQLQSFQPLWIEAGEAEQVPGDSGVGIEAPVLLDHADTFELHLLDLIALARCNLALQPDKVSAALQLGLE